MPGIRAALCDYLNLRACRAIEIRSLVGGIHFEFLDAVEWRRHNTGWSATDRVRDDASRWVAGEARGINLHAAIHVIGVLAAIKHESALVDHGSSDAAIGRNARLQGHKRTGVPANGGQGLQHITRYAVPDRGVQCLQLGAGCGDFHDLANRTEFHGGIQSKRRSNIHNLASKLCYAETGLINGYVVSSWSDVGKDVPSGFIRRRFS